MAKVSVVVMSEFGWRVAENASRGTEHGQGEALLVLSGNLSAGVPVYTRGFSLAPEKPDDGDLTITTDYRNVLAELIRKRLKNPVAETIFPITPRPKPGCSGNRAVQGDIKCGVKRRKLQRRLYR